MTFPMYPQTKLGYYRVIILLFFGICFTLYANSLGNDFVFDDVGLIVENESITNFKHIGDFFPSSKKLSGYRPVRFLSYLLDYKIYGLNPMGFRFSNIIYHTLNGFLVFQLARLLGLGIYGAYFSALIFLLHPLQTESVAYISGRRDILFTLFYLLGLNFFIKNYQRLNLYKTLFLVFVMILGFFSKEMAASFPLMVLWIAFWLEMNTRKSRVTNLWSFTTIRQIGLSIIKKTGLFLGVIFFLTVLFVLYKIFYWSPTGHNPYWGGNIVTNFLTVSKIWVYYIGLIILPVPLKGDYSVAAFPIVNEVTEPLAWLCLILILAMIILSLSLIKRKPYISFASVWFAISLLPVSHIIPHHEIMAEHYLYLPLVAFSILMGWFLTYNVKRGFSGRTIIILVVLLSFYTSRTMIRNKDWQSSFQFWKSTVRFEPLAARACLNVGVLYDDYGNENNFLYYMNRSVAIKPSAKAVYNLAIYYQSKGFQEKAILLYRQAMELDPTFTKAYFNLGFLYKTMNEYELAHQTFRSLEGFRENADLLFAIGITYYDSGDTSKAMSFLEQVVLLDPSYIGAYYYLGLCYEKGHNYLKAMESYKRECDNQTRFTPISCGHYNTLRTKIGRD